ncbi:AAA family ATPase [candidate division CSSED10-310 bacterium]|uniref:AAA family ATPase n=1 Tax=candidate division CSSED10-310 bacterium TaxID=2855610 RepID=A0ABV6YZM3_UNCC1
MLKKRGLTVGKFAPLHKGHQFLIETALAEMDEVIVIIYDCAQTTAVPLTVRSQWLKNIYPQVRVIEAWQGPTEVGHSPEIKKKHEDYIINSLGLKNITHFYCSEFYGEHMSLALGAENRLVDRERSVVPVSGTAIRADPAQFRQYLHPVVYRDLITNVVFLGAPSTGKTTITSELAREYNTVCMLEYGREYWEKHHSQRRLSPEQLVKVAEGHLAREEQLLYQANRYLFTDTNALTTYMFALYYHGSAHQRLSELALQSASRYDLVFVCDTDIPYDDTWDRSGNVNRQTFQKQIISDLLIRKIPFFMLRGPLKKRIELVKKILTKYKKYENLLELFTNWT